MTQPTNTFATNDMVGIREDLSDVINNIAPSDTPFYSMAKHVKATAALHEWQTDTLTAAVATNAVIEGDDVAADAATATVRLTNVTQLSDKAATVSSRARAVTTAGRADEMDYQMLLRGKELKRDVETQLLSNRPKVTGNDTTAPESAGIGAWIGTNDDFNASDGGSPSPITGADARTDGTVRAFTEDQLKNVLLLCFNQGGNPSVLMVGGFNRQVASSFATGRTNIQPVTDDTLHATFSVYESDFGTLKIVPNRFQRARDALVLDMDYWRVAVLQPMHSFDKAKTGHADTKVVAIEYTLESGQEKASGGVFDLSSS
jgi:hypothetical protein